jgi:hypothetical protein
LLEEATSFILRKTFFAISGLGRSLQNIQKQPFSGLIL